MSKYVPRVMSPKRIARFERMIELLSRRPMSPCALAAEFHCKVETIRGDLQGYDGVLFRKVKEQSRAGGRSAAALFAPFSADITTERVRHIIAPGLHDWWPQADRIVEHAMRSMVLV